MTDKIEMTVTFQVTPAQGLALQSMFEYWNLLSSWGSSRHTTFFADGDGNFHPKSKISFDGKIPEFTDYIQKTSIIKDHDGNVTFNANMLAWMLHSKKQQ